MDKKPEAGAPEKKPIESVGSPSTDKVVRETVKEKITAKRAWEILSEYPDTHGYDLAIRENKDGISLNDGVVNIDITHYTEQKLHQEIKDWIATAEDYRVTETEETVQRWPDAEFETSNPNQLGDILKSVGVLVEEIQVNIDESSLKVTQMDPSHHTLVDLSVGSYVFDRFNVTRPGVFAFNLSDTLKLVWKKKFKDATLKTTVEEENIIFEIRDRIKRRKSVILLEPLEEEVPKPKLYPMAKIRMSADALKRIVDDVQVSEHISIEADSDKVVFKSEGDMGKETFPLERSDENLFDLNVDGSQKATYDIRYLRDIVKGLRPLCDAVELKFSNDMPIQIDAEVSFDGHLIYYLAPCIGV